MIRKRLLERSALPGALGLDIETLASFEVTSESEGHPLELALIDNGEWWEAAYGGRQTIQLTFDVPQTITRVVLHFDEVETSRTHEFAVHWQSQGERRELCRQQFTFSPPNTTTERDEYNVSLSGVTGLSLTIDPAINGSGKAKLSLLEIH